MTEENHAFRWQDCERHGRNSGAELFIVEGDSAAKSVAAACDPKYQAVLPMQGKPVNAMKASRETIERFTLYQTVFAALGYVPSSVIDPSRSRFSRVVFLFDPDADGIHCGALMLMFFYRMMRPLLEDGIVCLVRAPMFEISFQGATENEAISERHYATTEEHARNLIAGQQSQGTTLLKKTRFRGLASLDAPTLHATCLDPKTRTLNRLRVEDAEAAIAAFGGAMQRRPARDLG